MKTRRFCPKCGRPLVKSCLTKGDRRYVFQCYGCQEDFYRFEVLRKSDVALVRQLQIMTLENEMAKNRHYHSIYRPYPKMENN